MIKIQIKLKDDKPNLGWQTISFFKDINKAKNQLTAFKQQFTKHDVRIK